ncbi:MAG: polyphosphate kinase 1 [Lachnospiraceae bacterium]|nr:polyphosphate kinase 1 [Lachnospiraceae bacterium]
MEACFDNRELSWLKFNQRVLEEAEDKTVPLAERLSFLSIFQSNLDEFFMVRVGSLQDQMAVAGDLRDNKTDMTAKEQIEAILVQSQKLQKRMGKSYKEIMKELTQVNVEILDFSKLKEDEAERLKKYFNLEIRPLLSPQIVGRRMPFPFLKNKEIYAVVVLETKGNNERIGIIPCNNGMFKRLIQVPGSRHKFMLAEELILHFVPEIFENYKVKSKSLLRIIRNADIDADEAAGDSELDYRKVMESMIKKRKRLCPVKAEFSREISDKSIESICGYLDLSKERVFRVSTPLDLSFVFDIQGMLREHKELFFERRFPQKSGSIVDNQNIIPQIKKKDILLSYPYESIRPFITMLNEATEDPDVVSIKMTLYRVAKNSKVIEALIEAAENGKEVVVLVELRARFDEENNISWSRRLEDAGCRVIYGLIGYKVHSKLCLITRKTKEGIEYITQIGTGNYNEKTAALYTDYSLLTASEEIGKEAARVFDALAMGSFIEDSEHLLVSPLCLRNKVVQMIDDEIAKADRNEEAYIGAKLNSLTDRAIIDKLMEASKHGVKVDLIVRGICCLIGGVSGVTDNIRVYSIVGRFLEHSRIYIFGAGSSAKVYIASADYMTRNTIRRVEVAAPIYDEEIKKKILHMFRIELKDNVKVREQQSDGTYVKRNPNGAKPLNSQEYFYEQAYKAAEEKKQSGVMKKLIGRFNL